MSSPLSTQLSQAEQAGQADHIEQTDALARLVGSRVVPVVVLDRAEQAPALADALVAGGITAVEITLRTPAAVDGIAAIAGRDDIIVGAGTVLDARQAESVLDAGAAFVVSPGLSRSVVEAAQQRGVPPVPGAATATEVMSAVDRGCRLVKLFPVHQLGGPRFVRALGAALGQVRFMPSGGITLQSAGGYLVDPSVAAIGGSWMVPRDVLREGAFADVTRLSRQTVIHLAHLTDRS